MSFPQDSSPQPFRWHYAEFDDSNFQIRGRTLFFIVVLFSAILLVALLFLYARWVCRFGGLPPPPASTSSAQLAHAPPPSAPQPRGLDPATINSFPIVLHKCSAPCAADGLSEAECCICLGIFDDGDKVKVLPQCRHCFHCECVDKWLTTQSSCPLCRASLRVDSPV